MSNCFGRLLVFFQKRFRSVAKMAQPCPQKLILCLLDRLKEPFIVPKGKGYAVFTSPNRDFLEERFQALADDLETCFVKGGQEKTSVLDINKQDLCFAMQLPRDQNFSLFIPYHREMAARLVGVFMGMRTFEDFLTISVFCRCHVNPYMFVYAFSVAVLHRPDTKNLRIPPLSEILPGKYMDSSVIMRGREEAKLGEDAREPIKISKDWTASDLEPEHRVAYFREDIGINLHHWHWHLVFPFCESREIVAKDRRGELFYYMHQQIQARYNFERLCNRLGRVKRLNDFREPIPEAYFPKLDSIIASRTWASRPSGAFLKDVNRKSEKMSFDIQDLERWRDRIIEAIQTGKVINDNGEIVELTEFEGIDILGNMIESSILTINRNLYGDLHNMTHNALGVCHDPDNRHLEEISPIGEAATAMRDPVFYRLHAFVDDLFQMHKKTLPPYTDVQLDFKGLRITGLEVNTQGMNPNELSTFWQERDVDLSHGLDFLCEGRVLLRITHLQHAPFTYKIQVENNTNQNVKGTVRIFMAPKFEEPGISMQFSDQKILFIQLDKFTVDLKSNPKESTIERPSSKSTVTIPWERTFRDLENDTSSGAAEGQASSYCGCGWPEHMLIPKGDAGGYPCELFAMITNSKDDLVDQPNCKDCTLDASSFCGLRDRKFPDKRPMGYPFDRMPPTGVNCLSQFLTPNMAVTDVKIVHYDRTDPPPNAPASNLKKKPTEFPDASATDILNTTGIAACE